MRKVRTNPRRCKSNDSVVEASAINDVDTTVALIPIGLRAVEEALQAEVTKLVGQRYERHRSYPDLARWGQQAGSVYLSDQKVPIQVPRVRNTRTNREVKLATYRQLHKPYESDRSLLLKVLHGLSCHQYEVAARLVPEVFGLSASTVSRRFIRTSSQKLEAFQKRRLEPYDFTALILDGKTFADDLMIIAVGVTLSGEKTFLGATETATENSLVCRQFLQSLVDRGLSYQQGLLCVVDGAKGLRKAIREVFGNYALVQRCQWHKRENVVSYLPKNQQADMRKRLQQAYENSTYKKAFKALQDCHRDLLQTNLSAAASLSEGLEETLTLHKLGVFPALGISLKTTNCLESVNAQLQRMLSRITRWRNSQQKHRWLAAALLEIEPRLRRIKGYRSLPQLRRALQRELKLKIMKVA